jgi:4-amino-4-deoxy-L-arabinose transferase-like glycosyltransferase
LPAHRITDARLRRVPRRGRRTTIAAGSVPAPSHPFPRRTYLGVICWVAAVGLALDAQHALTPFGQRGRGLVLYLGAVTAAIFGVTLIDRGDSNEASVGAPPHVEASPRGRSGATGTALITAGVSALVAAVALVETSRSAFLARALWLGALILLPVGVSLLERRRHAPAPAPMTRRRWLVTVGVMAILALALALRLPHLTGIPPDVHGDEAWTGLEAQRILRGEFPSFSVGWQAVPYLSFAIPAVGMRIFGQSLLVLRLTSVVLGTASVLLLYLVGRRLFSARVAAIAALLMAVSHWHIHFSRSGIHCMQAVFAELLLLFFLVRGVQRQRAADFLLAGLAAGLCFEVYWSARLTPVLAVLYLAHRAIVDRRDLRRQLHLALIFIAGTVTFAAPMAVFYVHHPETFASRGQSVFVLGPEGRSHEYSIYKVADVPDMLRIQARDTIEAFNLRGETSLQYGYRGPMLDFWTGALFVPGVAVAVWRIKNSSSFLLVTWLLLHLVLSALTIDPLVAHRALTVVPALCLCAALMVDLGWRGVDMVWGRAGVRAFAIPVLAFIALAAHANYHDYFDLLVKRMQPASLATTLARFSTVNRDHRIYLVGRSLMPLDHETVRYLAPALDGVDARNTPLTLPLEPPPDNGVAFIVAADALDGSARLDAIRAAYPHGRERLHRSAADVPLFTSYLVDRQEIEAPP